MPKRPAEVVGEQVRLFRQKRHWTQEELVKRFDDLGIPGWRQSKIAKIERGDAKRLPVDDLLELALALGCPPVMLLSPEDAGPNPNLEAVEIAPGRALPSRRVRAWIRGRDSLTDPEATETEKRATATFYYLESQPLLDWVITEDDFRLSEEVKRAYEAREVLLEQAMARHDEEMSVAQSPAEDPDA